MRKVILFLVLVFLFSGFVSATQLSFDFNASSSQSVVVNNPSIIYSSSVVIKVNTPIQTNCKISSLPANSYDEMSGVFDYNFGILHQKEIYDLSDGQHKRFVRCKNSSGFESGQMELSFNIIAPVSAQIVMSKSSPIGSGKFDVSVTTSKPVSELTLTYSLNGGSQINVPLVGAGNEWSGYIIIQNNVGEAVGNFKFSGKDLSGNVGQKISSGGIFLVDTISPKTIIDIKAVGYDGFVKIDWNLDEQVSEFKIYRSNNPNVRAVDFYKKSSTKGSFTDSSVERGKTYYYRVSAIDDADNEGDLSVEVSATALFSNTSFSQQVLSLELIGSVESVLSSIDSLSNAIRDLETSWNNKQGKEREIYVDLKMDKEIVSAKSEITALRKEVESYKNQALTKNDLDKKLSSADVKLNIIRKNLPESLIIKEEFAFDREISSKDIEYVLLQIMPDSNQKIIDSNLKKSLEYGKTGSLKMRNEVSNIDIVYFDGSRKSVSFVKEKISSQIERTQNLNFVLNFPSQISDSSNREVKNINYQNLKEGILGFDSDTKEIIYLINRQITLEIAKDIKLSLVYSGSEEQKSSFLTGYSVFVSPSVREYSGIIIGLIIIGILGSYFIFIRVSSSDKKNLSEMFKKMSDVEKKSESGDFVYASKAYNEIAKEFNNLNFVSRFNSKKKLNELHNKVLLNYCKAKISESLNSGVNEQEALKSVEDLVGRLPIEMQKSLRGKK